VEALYDGKGDNIPHGSPTITVPTGPEEDATDQALQVDGVFTTV